MGDFEPKLPKTPPPENGLRNHVKTNIKVAQRTCFQYRQLMESGMNMNNNTCRAYVATFSSIFELTVR